MTPSQAPDWLCARGCDVGAGHGQQSAAVSVTGFATSLKGLQLGLVRLKSKVSAMTSFVIQRVGVNEERPPAIGQLMGPAAHLPRGARAVRSVSGRAQLRLLRRQFYRLSLDDRVGAAYAPKAEESRHRKNCGLPNSKLCALIP